MSRKITKIHQVTTEYEKQLIRKVELLREELTNERHTKAIADRNAFKLSKRDLSELEVTVRCRIETIHDCMAYFDDPNEEELMAYKKELKIHERIHMKITKELDRLFRRSQ